MNLSSWPFRDFGVGVGVLDVELNHHPPSTMPYYPHLPWQERWVVESTTP